MSSPGAAVISPSVVIPNLAEEALNSEKIVLGSVLMDPARLSEVTAAGPDFTKQHQPVLDAMLGLVVSARDFDMSTLIDELHRRGQLAAIGGRPYICSLTEGLPGVLPSSRIAQRYDRPRFGGNLLGFATAFWLVATTCPPILRSR